MAWQVNPVKKESLLLSGFEGAENWPAGGWCTIPVLDACPFFSLFFFKGIFFVVETTLYDDMVVVTT